MSLFSFSSNALRPSRHYCRIAFNGDISFSINFPITPNSISIIEFNSHPNNEILIHFILCMPFLSNTYISVKVFDGSCLLFMRSFPFLSHGFNRKNRINVAVQIEHSTFASIISTTENPLTPSNLIINWRQYAPLCFVFGCCCCCCEHCSCARIAPQACKWKQSLDLRP